MNMNVFQAAQETGVRHIIFSSSIQVLGEHNSSNTDLRMCVPYLPLDGDAPANPKNAYALSKQVGEILLQYFAHARMSCVAIRYPWLIDSAKHDFARQKTGRVKKLDGVFSYLSFKDPAELIVAILGASLPGFRIYMPAHPNNRLGRSASDVVKEYYTSVPLRRPLKEIKSLIDISASKERLAGHWSCRPGGSNEISQIALVGTENFRKASGEVDADSLFASQQMCNPEVQCFN